MSEVQKIVRAVDSSMRMEGLPLSQDDKKRIEACLSDPQSFDAVLKELIRKHMVKSSGQRYVQKI
ncbi:MAG: hypothetical protein IJW81_07695 [Clostridia bacterium]|nr:hypothetical protein [Clostridia bacterium]